MRTPCESLFKKKKQSCKTQSSLHDQFEKQTTANQKIQKTTISKLEGSGSSLLINQEINTKKIDKVIFQNKNAYLSSHLEHIVEYLKST